VFLNLPLQAVVAIYVLAELGSVGHADLCGAAHGAPAVRVDVLFVEGHELSELGRHLKHPLDLTYIEEGKQRAESLTQSVPHNHSVNVGEVHITSLGSIYPGEGNVQQTLCQASVLVRHKEGKQVEKCCHFEKVVYPLNHLGDDVFELFFNSALSESSGIVPVPIRYYLSNLCQEIRQEDCQNH
jgi:hypothetical protein